MRVTSPIWDFHILDDKQEATEVSILLSFREIKITEALEMPEIGHKNVLLYIWTRYQRKSPDLALRK